MGAVPSPLDPSRADAIIRFQDFVRAQARRLHSSSFSHVPLDDLIQDGQIGLIKGVDTYDPSNTKGVSLKVWCYHTIRQAIVDAHRRKNYRNETAEWIGEEDDRTEAPSAEDVIVHRERLEKIEQAYRLLPARARIALETRRSGDRLKVAARKLGCTESAVCLLRQQAQRDFARILKMAGVSVRGI